MCYDNIVRDLGAITTAIKVTSKTFVSHSKSTSPEILLYTLTIQWLRVSLESNPELISTPAVELEAKFHEAEACGILRVEFSINSKIGFENN